MKINQVYLQKHSLLRSNSLEIDSPHGARVSGVVEETPGRLEYEVALYKEAPPVSRHSNHTVDLPVDQVTAVCALLFLYICS